MNTGTGTVKELSTCLEKLKWWRVFSEYRNCKCALSINLSCSDRKRED